MEITRETDYAIRCLLYLCKNEDRVVMMDEVSREMYIPKSFLAKILQKLTKASIVKSFRGVKGGFMLLKNPGETTLLEVIVAVQGPIFMSKCVVDKKICSRSGFCSVHPIWRSITDSVIKKISGYNFKKLVAIDKKAV
ncbi:MAG: Rrf2 family transcriptional regulator [Nitrospirae bacterium]|nr:Rrf2 family transcriptional regulator [Nitrospirota bacterium]